MKLPTKTFLISWNSFQTSEGVATRKSNDNTPWLGKSNLGRCNSSRYWVSESVSFDRLVELSFFSFLQLGDKRCDVVSGLFFDFDDSELKTIVENEFLQHYNYILYPSCSADPVNPKNWHLVVPLETPVTQEVARILLAVLLRDVFPEADPARSDPLPSIFGSDKIEIGSIAVSDRSFYDPSDLLARVTSPEALKETRELIQNLKVSQADRRVASAILPRGEGSTARNHYSLAALQNSLIHRELHGVVVGKIPDPNKVFDAYPHNFTERNTTRPGWIQWDGDHPWHESKSRKSFSVFYSPELGLFEFYDRISNCGGYWTAYAVNLIKGHNAHRDIAPKEFWLCLGRLLPVEVANKLTKTKNVDRLKAELYPDRFTYESKKITLPAKNETKTQTQELRDLTKSLSIDSESKNDQTQGSLRHGNSQALQNELENEVADAVFSAWASDCLPHIAADGKAFKFFDRVNTIWVYRSGANNLSSHVGSWAACHTDSIAGLGKCKLGTIVDTVVKYFLDRLPKFDGIYTTPGIVAFSNVLVNWTKGGLEIVPYDSNFPADRFEFYDKLPYPFTDAPDLSAVDRFKTLVRSMIILDSESRKDQLLKADLAAEIVTEWLSLALRKDGAGAKNILYLFGSGDAGKSTLAQIIGQFFGDAFLPATATTLQGQYLGSAIAPKTSLLFLDEFDPGNVSKSEGNLKQLSTFAGTNNQASAGLRLQEKYGGFRTQKQPYFFILASELCAGVALNPKHAGLGRRLVMLPVIANPSVLPLLADFQLRDEGDELQDALVNSNISSIASILIADPRSKNEIRNNLASIRKQYDEIVLYELRIKHEPCASFIYNALVLERRESPTFNCPITTASLYESFALFVSRFHSQESKYWCHVKFKECFEVLYPTFYRKKTGDHVSKDVLIKPIEGNTLNSHVLGICSISRS